MRTFQMLVQCLLLALLIEDSMAVAEFRMSWSNYDKIAVEWKHQPAQPDSYQIEYTDTEGKAQKKMFPGASTSGVIGNLVPATSYDFTIKSVTGSAVGEPLTLTAETRALQQVRRLQELPDDATESSVTLYWMSEYYEDDSYNLTVTENATGQAYTLADITSESLNVEVTYNVTGLKVGTFYTMKVVMVSGRYAGPEAAVVTNTKPAPPTGFQVSTYDTQKLKAVWVELPGLKYQVNFQMNSSSQPASQASQSSCVRSRCQFFVFGVQGELWKVYLYAVLNYKRSVPVSSLANTKPRMPAGVSEVTEKSNATSLTVEITPAAVMGIFQKYRVRIWNGSRVDMENRPAMKKIDLDKAAVPLQATFSDLLEGNVYHIGVACVTDFAESNSVIERFVTPNLRPPAPLGLIDVSDPAYMSMLTVKVTPPVTEVKIDRYKLAMWKGNSTEQPEDGVQEGEIASTMAELQTGFYDLEYTTLYTVCARSQVGFGTTTDSERICVAMTTPKPAIPASLTEVTVLTTASSLTAVVAYPKNYERLDSFNIRLWPGNNTKQPENPKLVNLGPFKFPLQATFDGLSAGTAYTASATTVVTLPGRQLESDPILAVFKTLTSGDHRCETITSDMCQNLDYNQTSFPNLLSQASQSEAILDLRNFMPLFSIQCSFYIQPFLCSMYFPKCVNDREQLKPCRAMCEKAQAGCEPIMQKYGFSWPESLNCDSLFDDDECYAVHNDTYDWDSEITVQAIGKTFVNVSWNEPRVPYLYFMLSASPEDRQANIPKVDISMSGAAPMYSFTNLTAGMQYSVAVQLVDGSNRIITGSVIITTEGGPPIHRLTAVYEKADNVSKVKVDFSVGNVDNQSTFKVTVNYTDASVPPEVYSVAYVADQNNYTLEKPLQGDKCVDSVCASVANDGDITEQKCVTSYIGPDITQTLRKAVKSDTSLQFTWDRLPCADRYTATCSSKIHAEVIEAPSSEMPVTFADLYPGDQYTCTLTELGREITLATADVIVVINPKQPVVSWDKANVTTTSLTVLLSCNETVTAIQRYFLQLYQAGVDSPVQNFTTQDSTATSHSFSELVPGQTYSVHVYSESFESTRSLTYTEVVATTKPVIDTVLVEAPDFTDAFSLTVDYTPSFGVFDTYRFSITPGNQSVTKPKSNTVNLNVTFSDLDPSVLYTVSVVAVSQDVASDPVQTKVLTAPIAPAVSCSRTGSVVTLTVAEDKTRSAADLPLQYLYWCRLLDGSSWKDSGYTNNSSYQFGDLDKDEKYTFDIASIASAADGNTLFTKKSFTSLNCDPPKDSAQSGITTTHKIGLGIGLAVAALVVVAVVIVVLVRKGKFRSWMARNEGYSPHSGGGVSFSNNTYDVLQRGNSQEDAQGFFGDSDVSTFK